mmetsp:Transcript_22293/g.76812  ORF Transcript_22293/g.76812 Transcript_22293/m.76812 type:complete len:130 (+) Transcript_22293:170-559(+)
MSGRLARAARGVRRETPRGLAPRERNFSRARPVEREAPEVEAEIERHRLLDLGLDASRGILRARSLGARADRGVSYALPLERGEPHRTDDFRALFPDRFADGRELTRVSLCLDQIEPVTQQDPCWPVHL